MHEYIADSDEQESTFFFQPASAILIHASGTLVDTLPKAWGVQENHLESFHHKRGVHLRQLRKLNGISSPSDPNLSFSLMLKYLVHPHERSTNLDEQRQPKRSLAHPLLSHFSAPWVLCF